jgi:hypothetical protein
VPRPSHADPPSSTCPQQFALQRRYKARRRRALLWVRVPQASQERMARWREARRQVWPQPCKHLRHDHRNRQALVARLWDKQWRTQYNAAPLVHSIIVGGTQRPQMRVGTDGRRDGRAWRRTMGSIKTQVVHGGLVSLVPQATKHPLPLMC